jgi:hypothetical protein
MPDYATAIITGVGMGLIHGTVLLAATLSLATASFILYGDILYLPTEITYIVDIVMLATVLTSGYWLPKIMDSRDRFIEKYGVEVDEEP